MKIELNKVARSRTSAMGPTSATGMASSSNGELPLDVIKCGLLKKLKTMKKKYFVLRVESDHGPARLEYYDSEKKWRLANANGSSIVPKRSIILKTCFNINKKMDSKQKHAVALYTNDDCFAIAMESEIELEEWLNLLLALQQGHTDFSGDFSLLDMESKPKPNFEHVWQVGVKNKGLGSSKNISGPHRLCLTSKTLSLIKMNSDTKTLEFPLMSIRRCGHSDCFFFMELGRSACTGAGEFWMQTEDTIIAQNVHEAILGAMKSSRSHEDLGTFVRPRSASTSENSKIISSRGPMGVSTASGIPPNSSGIGTCSTSSTTSVSSMGTERNPIICSSSLTHPPHFHHGGGPRDRCDSMPTSRSRTVSEGHHDLPPRSSYYVEMTRPHSIYSHSISYSPPVPPNPLSPSSGAHSDSAGSSLSIDDFESPSEYHHRYLGHTECTLHTEPTITEEGNDDYQFMTSEGIDSNSGLDPHPFFFNHPVNSNNDYLQMKVSGSIPKPNQRSSLTSMFLNLTSASQNAFSNPNSPSSIYGGHKVGGGNQILYGINNATNRLNENSQLDIGSSRNSSLNGYLDMTSPSTPSLPETSTLDGYLPMSPGSALNNLSHGSFKIAHKHNSLDIEARPHSGSAEFSDEYMSMGPSEDGSRSGTSLGAFQSHHRQSGTDGYLDMTVKSSSLPKVEYALFGNSINSAISANGELLSPSRSTHSLDMSSSCSPAEMEGFHLDKVKSFFPPTDEDTDDYIKPVRAYSIGSRPQVSSRKSHLGSHLDQFRVRAYSSGSHIHSNRTGKNLPRNGGNNSSYSYSGIEAELGTFQNLDSRVSKKSNSAPLLPAMTGAGARVQNQGSSHVSSAVSKPIATNPGGSNRANRPPSSNSRSEHNEDLMEIVYQQPSPNTSGRHMVKAASQDSADMDHSNRRYSIGSYRQRTNSRSSNSSMSNSLKSNHLERETIKNHLTKTSQKDPRPFQMEATNQGSRNGNYETHQTLKSKEGVTEGLPSLGSSDYMEMTPDPMGQETSDASLHSKLRTLPCEKSLPKTSSSQLQINAKPQGSLATSASPSDLSGDYVNLDVSKVSKEQLGNANGPHIVTTKLVHGVSSDQNEVNPFALHDYVNVKSPGLQTNDSNPLKQTASPATPQMSLPSSTQQYSDYAIMSPVEIPTAGMVLGDGPTIRGNIDSIRYNSKGVLPQRQSSLTGPVLFNGTANQKQDGAYTIFTPLSQMRQNSDTSLSEDSKNDALVSQNSTESNYQNLQVGNTSQPQSDSCERELNYASLDLAPASSTDEEKLPRSPRTSKSSKGSPLGSRQEGLQENGAIGNLDPPLAYAEIDFTKSEGLRNVSGAVREGRVGGK